MTEDGRGAVIVALNRSRLGGSLIRNFRGGSSLFISCFFNVAETESRMISP
jgi:hypothetical protein